MKKEISVNKFKEDLWQSRRDFLVRASGLFAAMGLAPTIQSELVEKIGRKLGIPSSTLLANGLDTSAASMNFVIELRFRSGFPIPEVLFPLDADRNNGSGGRAVSANTCPNQPDVEQNLRAVIHRPEEQLTKAGDNAGTFVHLTPWASQLQYLWDNGINIASTCAVAQTGGHTADHPVVRANGTSAPSPAAFIAGLYKDTAVAPLIQIGAANNVQVRTGPYSGLLRTVSNPGNFLKLFEAVPIPKVFKANKDDNARMQIIFDAVKKLNDKFVVEAKKLNSSEMTEAAKTGMDLMMNDLATQMQLTAEEQAAFNVNDHMQAASIGQGIKAMGARAVRSIVCDVNTGDWHGYLDNRSISETQMARMNTAHAIWGTRVARWITEAYKLAATIRNPNATDGRMLDKNLNFVLASEFIRGASRRATCDDISDGGRDGFAIIGNGVKNITAGDWAPNANGAMSFNRQTGINNSTDARLSYADAYATICAALGISSENVSKVGVTGTAAFAMLKG